MIGGYISKAHNNIVLIVMVFKQALQVSLPLAERRVEAQF